MVTEITDKELMTLKELRKKYDKKWFRFIIVGDMNDDDPESDMCYVVITADTEDELYGHPYPDRNLYNGGICTGINVIFPLEVGGIYVHA